MLTGVKSIKEGNFTNTIYSMIKDQKYVDAVNVLNEILLTNSKSRAVYSLLGYCLFQLQDFPAAAQCYQQLTNLCPDEPEYKLYLAQSLYQACLYEEAMDIVAQIDAPHLQVQVNKLKASIKYGEGDLVMAKSLLANEESDDVDTEVYHGCVLYKEERYEEALEKLTSAMTKCGYEAHLSYNIALCYYKLKEFTAALKHIGDIIERGIREHPELSVGTSTEGIEVRSVGNTLTLHDTALIEAFNLKAAIEYNLKNFEAAKEAMTDMPPRAEEELDAVTLHNQALINMDTNTSEGFEKLQFLLQQNPYPPETFHTLLLLYCKYEYYDLAADVLAENSHLAGKYLSPYLYEFLDALIIKQTSPEEAYRKFDEIASKHTDVLRKLTKQVQKARSNHDNEAVKKAVVAYEEALDRYIPVLMAQAKIFWDMENYEQVEKIFRKSVEFSKDNDLWQLNVAHVLFMQENKDGLNKFKEASGFYESIVKKNSDKLLSLSAVVLANLCVSYIMTTRNEEAEELMRKIEKEEEQVLYEDPEKKLFHLCIVNLVIGTLYCSKGNYEFGISRIIKSLEPHHRKLGTDTWYYTKRCFISLIENLAKNMIIISDAIFQDCFDFLDECENHGKSIKSMIENPLEIVLNDGKNTVAYEARLLKYLLLKVHELE